MNKTEFDKQYMCNFEVSQTYPEVLQRVRFDTTEATARELMYRIETQKQLEERIDNLKVECDSRLKQIAYQQDQINTLNEHIQNLKKASQDYCMCGMRIDPKTSHCGAPGHSSISEFDWYIKEHNL